MKNFVAVSITITASLATLIFAQEKPAFEVATVKLAAPNAVQNRMIHVSPNRISIPSMSLIWLVYTAYGEGMSTSVNVSGGPDWGKQTAYAIEGVAAKPVTIPQIQAMLRTLLEDRFALKVRINVTQGNVLALVLDRSDGKLGPRVRPWDGNCPNGQTPAEDDDPHYARCISGTQSNGIFITGATMFSVAEVLSLPAPRNLLGNVVQDRTGLTGRYKMDLPYPLVTPRPADPTTPPDLSQPSLSTAIREQWGLKLEPAQGPFKRIVIDDAQRPTPN